MNDPRYQLPALESSDIEALRSLLIEVSRRFGKAYDLLIAGKMKGIPVPAAYELMSVQVILHGRDSVIPKETPILRVVREEELSPWMERVHDSEAACIAAEPGKPKGAA